MTFLSIKNLNKVYQSKNIEDVQALKDINLSFQQKGLVFIVGKSGSGKSTLLNIIGGLDSATSGDITLMDRDYSSFSHHDFNILRKYDISFIFQDFSLIEHMTVYENLRLAIAIRNETLSVEEANNVLKEVGLDGYSKRLVSQLSAGQKQRVAIARAIIKKPRVLLCDEPTGNLDFVTSKEILKMLKKISKISLVILVSHNLEDAYFYADRIIELEQGSVINDSDLNEQGLKDPKSVYLSGLDFLDENKLSNINEQMKTGEVLQVKSRKALFVPHQDKDEVIEPKEKLDETISFKKSFKLTVRLLKKQFANIALLSFAVSILLSIFGVSLLFATYDGKDTYLQIAAKNPNIDQIYRKKTDAHTTNTRYLTLINDKDLQEYEKMGYKDKAYPLVNYPSERSVSLYLQKGVADVLYQNTSSDFSVVFDNFLTVRSHNGILITNENYVKELYGIEGEVEYLARLDEFQDYGYFITDFTADNYFKYTKENNQDYNKLLGYQVLNPNTSTRYNIRYINGVIKTNYKERFKVELEKISEYSSDAKKMSQYKKSKEGFNYMKNTYNYYDIGFSYNKKYIESMITSDALQSVRTVRAEYKIDIDGEEILLHNYQNTSSSTTTQTEKLTYYSASTVVSANQTIGFPYAYLNTLTDKNLTYEEWKEIIGTDKKITISCYSQAGDTVVKEFIYNFKVTSWSSSLAASKDVVEEQLRYALSYSHVYFDVKRDDGLFATMLNKGYVNASVNSVHIDRIVSGVDVYTDLFHVILAFALVSAMLFLGFTVYHSVRRFSYEIGVIKSLGGSTREVFRIFLFQHLYLYLISLTLSTLFFNLLTFLSNTVLLDAFNRGSKIKIDLTILFVTPRAVLIIFGVISLTCVVALIMPFIQVKRLKPINILKAKY